MGVPMINAAKSVPVVTKMTNNYANIQRNKQIFNAITKNNQFKQSTNKILLRAKGKSYAKSSRDLESMMKHIELKGIDDSKPENVSRSLSLGSNKTVSTPKGMVSNNKVMAKKPR